MPRRLPNRRSSSYTAPGRIASGWYDVTLALQARGYKVVAVQNSLFSYAKDIETTKRVLDAQQGPIVVVGHSYGGAVITAAAAAIQRQVTRLCGGVRTRLE